MRDLLSFLMAAVVAIAMNAEVRVINLDANSNVSEILGDDILTIDSMKVNGYLSHKNLTSISWMVNRHLEYLDLGDCSIEGNEIPAKGLCPTPLQANPGETHYAIILKRVILPQSVEKIGEYALCAAPLESLELPASLKEIGDWAFNGCSKITGKLVFPDKVEKIGYMAFCNCYGITSISLPEGLTELGGHCFEGLTHLEEMNFPSTLTTIGEGACKGWYRFTAEKLEIGAGVTTLGRTAFQDCKLQKVVFDPANEITTINEGTFKDCGITEITLPSACARIEQNALSGNNFETVVLPSTLTYLGAYAFADCGKLANVYVAAAVPPTAETTSIGGTASKQLYVPIGSKAAYEADSFWGTFGTITETNDFSGVNASEIPAVRAYGAEGMAVVAGEVRYEIVGIDGRSVATGIASQNTQIPLPAGIYVVIANSNAQKIIVK